MLNIGRTLMGKCCYSTSQQKPAAALRRAMLYVPGSDDRKVAKALQHESLDSLCLDLEDSVTAAKKPEGREKVIIALEAATDTQIERCVRINSLRSTFFEEDLSVLNSPHLQALVVPKVESAQDIQVVSSLLDKHAASKNVRIVASLESARAVMFAREIAASSPRLSALLFAAEDYCASSGIQRSASRNELNFARSMTVNAAKAFNLEAIDLVCVHYKDTAILAEEALEGARMGFDGKQAIHPGQIDTIQSAFSPGIEQTARAVAILEQNVAAEQAGKGAFGLQGHSGEMIDAPMLLQARRTIAKAQAAGHEIPWTTGPL